MPIYVYKCQCGAGQEVVKPIAELDRQELCAECHTPMARIICAPAVRGDYEGYHCPVSGNWIEGRRAHEENLKRTGCRVYDPGEKDQMLRRKKDDDAKLEKVFDESVEASIHSMPAVSRDRLVAEVQNGLNVSVDRVSPKT